MPILHFYCWVSVSQSPPPRCATWKMGEGCFPAAGVTPERRPWHCQWLHVHKVDGFIGILPFSRCSLSEGNRNGQFWPSSVRTNELWTDTGFSRTERDDLESRGCFGWRREPIKLSAIHLTLNRFSVKCKWSGRRNTWSGAQTVSGHHF